MKNLLTLLTIALCILSATSWAERALTLESAKDYRKAEDALNKILEQHPEYQPEQEELDDSLTKDEIVNMLISELNKVPFKGEVLTAFKKYGFADAKEYFNFMVDSTRKVTHAFADQAEINRIIVSIKAEIKEADANKNMEVSTELKSYLKYYKQMDESIKSITPADLAMIKKHPEIIKLIAPDYVTENDHDNESDTYEEAY